ncbi:efflux RND transporter periplasmic adaptor subunit [Urechidicola vernalis]|uniref:Efflux RND transporter periplasmic adaptor subunit n=1 Tax=Urechidicola vernalis TaxID=3075600 RepID=A0ABU2Y1D4_9FLAO|nr:efflux RND transporter periplasmic adaptor subunit [Urechidicola sp. P050]MDT0551817.1 efflux RND transporter periplasmic adaptor subunit [Urechidicola sp. P050]
MKKYSIYIGILAIGLFIGWLLFGGSSTTEPTHNHNKSAQENKQWTCSMHPQILQPEVGDCPICGMDLIPAEAGADGLAADQFKLTNNAMALANIQTTIIEGGNSTTNALKLSGKIVENADATATQPSHYTGRIEKLYVNSVGETVKLYQPIALVYSADLVTAQQELLTAHKLKETQPKLYEAVRNKFKNWNISNSELDEIVRSGKIKTRFTLHSHIAGTVSEINLNVGSHIMKGQAIFKVSNLKSVWANFDVYENQIDLFKVGQSISVTTKAYPNEEFEAQISFIDPILNSSKRTVNIRVVLKNKDGLFKPGMFVEGLVANENPVENTTVQIPSSAIMWTGKRSIVYIKPNSKEPVFEMREITLGNKFGDLYEVTSGVKPGEEIVTNGTFTIDAAAQLNGKKSMMNNSNSTESTEETIERIEVSTKFQGQLKTVFDNYIVLKDALVQDDASTANSNASILLESLKKVNMKLLPNSKSHKLWMPLEKEMKAMGQTIASTTDIEKQRVHFMLLSDAITKAVQTFGINQLVYQQFCPMANDDNGAHWLSLESEILNPYFGDMMLNCGSVKQEIE